MTVRTVVALAGLLSWVRDMVDADSDFAMREEVEGEKCKA
jgi:predicted phosphohydrolase